MTDTRGSIARTVRHAVGLMALRGWIVAHEVRKRAVSTRHRAADAAQARLIDLAPIPMITDPGPVAAYGVYRSARAGMMRSLVDALPEGSMVSLHALDDVAPTLRDFTISQGPGRRTELLNALAAAQPPDGRSAMLFDDDVTLEPESSLAQFVWIAERAGLDVAQPAHSRASHASHALTRPRTGVVVRRTTFVEVGPLVWVSPQAVNKILPMPMLSPMGWGIDVHWAGLARQGLRLGIVDWVRIVHNGPVGQMYVVEEEQANLDRELEQLGAKSVDDIAATTGLPLRRWNYGDGSLPMGRCALRTRVRL